MGGRVDIGRLSRRIAGYPSHMFAKTLRWALPALAMWAWRRYSQRRSTTA